MNQSGYMFGQILLYILIFLIAMYLIRSKIEKSAAKKRAIKERQEQELLQRLQDDENLQINADDDPDESADIAVPNSAVDKNTQDEEILEIHEDGE